MDYNEKLIAWGLHIHAAVDGYSRYILWETLTFDKKSTTGKYCSRYLTFSVATVP